MKNSVLSSLMAHLPPLRARWYSLPIRDRRAIAILTIFFVLMSIWLLIVAPVLDYADKARKDIAAAQADFDWMQTNAMRARQAATRGAVSHLAAGQSLLSAVSSSAKEAGLNLQRFDPEGERRVRVTLENAVFTDVMSWLVELENRYGLVVEDFNADGRPQPGIVNIRLTLGVSS
ncbi:MAG: type II secretion system protein GspM [Pseudomonadota bacterium]